MRVIIVKAIDELSLTAAAGPDGFPAFFLKYCKESLSKPLYIFWRKCLDQGTILQSLTDANIIPLHKGDNRGHAANYRPVALTSHLIKIFEKIIKKHVFYMEEKNLFNNTQHGFRPGRSCLSELISHYEDVLSLLEEGVNVDTIYLDFAKAFDKVDFSILLEKLNGLGICGKLGRQGFQFIFQWSEILFSR